VIPYRKLWKILAWVKAIPPVDGRVMNAYAEAVFTDRGQEKTIVRLTRTLFPTLVLVALATIVNPQSPVGGVRSTPIGIGDIAPDFTLTDQDGRKVTLSEARRIGPVVLVFYRGYW
jgi:cytochrome oxidase Cu insertion factor (SCO1/SenC/PrrC family)